MENLEKKKDFYYTIHSFMTHELGLKGSALVVYAIIYAFSGSGSSTFHGTLDFIAKHTGTCQNSARQAIKQLLNNGLIYLDHIDLRNVKFYKVNLEKVPPQNFKTAPSNFEAHPLNFCNNTPQILKSTPANSAPNNKYNNKNNNKYIYNPNKSEEEKKNVSGVKYLGFDPEEAFRLALQRTEEEWAKNK